MAGVIISDKELFINDSGKYAVITKAIVTEKGISVEKDYKKQILKGSQLRALTIRHLDKIFSATEIVDNIKKCKCGEITSLDCISLDEEPITIPISTVNYINHVPSGAPNCGSSTTDRAGRDLKVPWK